jgi:hypothetical protein
MTRNVTIFSPSITTKKIDGAALTHFNHVIKQKTRFNLSLKPNKKRVQPNQKKWIDFDPTHIVPKLNTCIFSDNNKKWTRFI